MTILTTDVARPRARRRPHLTPLGVLGAAFLAVVAVAAIAAPLVISTDPNKNDYSALFELPSLDHILGTDQLGRDILVRLVYGGRVSLTGVVEAVAVYLAVGLVIGLVAGYVGGVIDALVVWLADLSFAVPQIIVILAVLAIFSNNAHAAMVVLGLLGAPGLAVLVRGATRSVKQEQFIAAARVSGLRTSQILRRHVLPQVFGPVVVQTSLFAGAALLFQTGLDFLGIGTQPPTASWGAMVAEASRYIPRDPWMIVPPGLVIALTIMALGLLGDSVRDSRSIARSAISPARPDGNPGPSAAHDTEHASAEVGLAALQLHTSTREELPDAVLSVRNLSIALQDSGGPRPIVKGVSFDLQPGQCLGIVGESGCGKSMTAFGILGLLPEQVVLHEGTVRLGGRHLETLSPTGFARLRGGEISLISQEPVASLDPSFSVGAQIAEIARRHLNLSRRAAKAEAHRLLKKVRLPEPQAVARRFPHELSGGMAQRVAIAAALAGRPKVLIADEPTTALDVTVQAEILSLIENLRKEENLAVVLVSHDWGVIAQACDRALVMYAGEVVEEAPILELFRQPRHPYTCGLMASNPQYAEHPRILLEALPGSVPRIGEWPNHCRFAARCHFAEQACLQGEIPLYEIKPAHHVRCIRPDRAAQDYDQLSGGRRV